MQTYDYFNSFIIQSFPRPIKGIEQLKEGQLFILLDDGTCLIFSLDKMKILHEQKYPELAYATQCTKFSVLNEKNGEVRDLIMTQHKLGYLGVLMVEENSNNILLLQKIYIAYTGFMKMLPNEEVFSYKNGFIQQRNVLSNQCFIYSPNRKECTIEKLNLQDGSPLCQFQFYEEKFVDTISCMKKVIITTEVKTHNLLVVAYEGLYMSIMDLNEENQEYKFILPRTKVIESKEEMPYIFDFQMSVSLKEPNNDVVISIYICSSVEELHVLKYNLTLKQIISQKNATIKYISPQIGLSNIQMDKKQLYISTLDRQLKIVSRNKLTEICSFQFHNHSINGVLLIKDNKENEEGQKKSKYLISISEDCKMAVIDLDKLRKKK